MDRQRDFHKNVTIKFLEIAPFTSSIGELPINWPHIRTKGKKWRKKWIFFFGDERALRMLLCYILLIYIDNPLVPYQHPA